jgi:dihydroorotase
LPDTTVALVGGRVIDPANGLDGAADVIVADGRIVEVAPGAAQRYPGAVVRDCSGSLVTPGLIDLHTHVVPGFGDFCVHPDRAGVSCAVTTVVDAGTSGTATIGLVRSRVQAPDVATRVLLLVDPCRVYLATKDYLPHRLHLADDPKNLDLGLAAEVLEAHAGVVVGLKARACTIDDPHASPFLDGAVAVAGDRPVMVHLGAFPYTPSLSTADTLRALRPGDVVTHAFRGHSGVVSDDGSVLPAFAEAVEAGLHLDVGHSGSDFRFTVARDLFDRGYLPTTVSTDLNLFNSDGPVHSLVEVMSKMLALGVELPKVVAMATTGPARVLRMQAELGTLSPNAVADVSVLQMTDGDFAFSDGFETMPATRRLMPVGCLRAGCWYDAAAYAVSAALEPAA